MGLSNRELMQLEVNASVGQAVSALGTVQGAVAKTGVAVNRASFAALGMSLAYGQASRILLGYGAAVTGIAAVTGKLAVNYSKDMALVRTQTDMTAKEFETIESAVLSVSNKTGKSTTELAEGLYDIFSGINVGGEEAIHILNLMAQAAIAGNTDVRTVARATIGMFNAFNLTAADTNRILDAQFAFVRLGVGTYEDFATQLGSLSGSATAGGQSLETMVAALAVATKGALSTSEAVTATARAIDLVTRPDNVQSLEDYGIVMRDAQGEFFQMNEIVGQMAAKMDGLTLPQRKQALADIFGEGEIRAMRFFNIAIPRMDLFEDAVKRTAGPGAMGQMNRAFEVMRDSAAFSVQKTLNLFKNVGIVIGQSFLPAIKDALGFLVKGVQAIANMDPQTRKTIATILLFSGVLSLLVGVVFRIISNIYNLISAVKLAGIDFLAFRSSILGTIGIISVLIGVVDQLTGGNFGMLPFIVGGIAIALAKAWTPLRNFVTYIGTASPAIKRFVIEMTIANSMMGTVEGSLGATGAAFGSFGRLVGGVFMELLPVLGAIAIIGLTFKAITDYQNDAKIATANYQKKVDELSKAMRTNTASINPYVKALRDLGRGFGVDTSPAIRLLQQTFDDVGTDVGAWEDKLKSASATLIENRNEALKNASTYQEVQAILHQYGTSLTFIQFALGLVKDAQEDAKQALHEQIKEAEEGGTKFSKYATEAIGAAEANKDFALASKIVEAQQAATENATEIAGNAFSDLAEKARLSFAQIEKYFQHQLDVTLAWTSNVRALLKQGIPADFVKELFDLGPAGMAIADQMAQASRKANMQIVRDWRKTKHTIEQTELKITIGADTGPAKAAIDNLKAYAANQRVNIDTGMQLDPGRGAYYEDPGADRRAKSSKNESRTVEDTAYSYNEYADSADNASGSADKFTDAQQKAIDKVEELEGQLDEVVEAFKDFRKAGAHLDAYTKSIIAAQLRTQDFEGAVETLGYALENFNEAATEATDVLAGIGEGASEAADVASGAFDDLLGKIDEFADAGGLFPSDIQAAMNNQLEGIQSYAEDWTKLLGRGLPLELLQQLKDMGLGGAAIVHSLAGANEQQFNDIVGAWQASEEAMSKVWDDIDKAAAKASKSILDNQKDLLKTIKQYGNDWDKILKRGLPKALAQQLKDMGLEGREVIHALATANEHEFNEIIRTWKKSANALSETFNKVDALGTKIKNLPNGDIKVKVELDDAREKLNAWTDQIKALDIGIEVASSGLAPPHDSSAHGKGHHKVHKHTGGAVGKIPGMGDVPAVLKGGEYVFAAEAVRNIGEDTLNAWHNAAKYHQGGLVDTGTPHGHATFNFQSVSDAVQQLYDDLTAFRLSGQSAAGLNAKANFALSAVTGTFPWTYLLSGYRPGAIIHNSGGVPSQHGVGNAIDISTHQALSNLWEVWDWEMKNRQKLQIDYSVLAAEGRPPLQYSRGSFSTPSATNIADHWNHIHMDFLRKGGIVTQKMMGMFEGSSKEAVIPLQTASGRQALADAMITAMAMAAPARHPVVGSGGESVRDVHLHYHGPQRPDAKEMVQELDWNRRTSGW